MALGLARPDEFLFHFSETLTKKTSMEEGQPSEKTVHLYLKLYFVMNVH